MSFFRNAAGLLASSVATVPLGMVTGIVLARWLSVEERGLYGVATVIGGTAAMLAVFGWPNASIYQLRRVGTPLPRVAGAGLVATIGFSTAAVGLCLLFEPWILSRFLRGSPPLVLHLALATVPGTILTNVYAGIARGIDRFSIQYASRVANAVVQLAAFVLVLVVMGEQLIGVLWALLAVNIAMACAVFAVTVRHTGLSLRVPLGEIRDSFRFGSKSYLQNLAGHLHERVDLFMIAAILDPEAVAFYAIAAGLVTRLKMIPEAFAAAAYPQLAGLEPEAASHFACRVSRQSFAGVLGVAVPVGVVAPWIVPLFYGAPYAASVAPFLVLLPGMALLTIYRVISRWFTAMDRQRANIGSQLFSLCVNVMLNLWWIPRIGILGAALASLASYGLEAVLIVVLFTRASGRSTAELLVFRKEDAAPYRTRLAALRRRVLGPG